MSQLEKQVQKAYSFRIRKLKTIKYKRKSSFVGKIITSTGEKFVIKSLFTNKDRQQFIAKTEELLAKKGFKLAKPILTRNKQLYFIFKGFPYVVYEWVKGKNHRLNSLNDLESSAKTIAKLHKASFGLVYPKKIKVTYSNFAP